MNSVAIIIHVFILVQEIGPGGSACATRGGVAMRSWPLLLPPFTFFSFLFFLRLSLLTHSGESSFFTFYDQRSVTVAWANRSPRSFPKGVKSRRRRKKREKNLKVGNNNGQPCIATPPRLAHAKPPWPIYSMFKSRLHTPRVNSNI